MDGIKEWKLKHVCNPVCAALDLPMVPSEVGIKLFLFPSSSIYDLVPFFRRRASLSRCSAGCLLRSKRSIA
jgi:hypothetical protein